MEGAREGGSVGTGIGAVRAAIGKDRGSYKTGRDWSTAASDSERTKVSVEGRYGVREVQYGRSPLGGQSSNRKCRGAWQAAGANGRGEVCRGGVKVGVGREGSF